MKNSIQNLLVAVVLFVFFIASTGRKDGQKQGVSLNFIDSLKHGFNIMLNRDEKTGNEGNIQNRRLKTGEIQGSKRLYDDEIDPDFVPFTSTLTGLFPEYEKIRKLKKRSFGYFKNQFN